MPFIVFTVIRTHASSHIFVEPASNSQDRLWYAETCEHHPQPLSVDGVLCHLEIDEENQTGVLLARLSFCNRRKKNASNTLFLDAKEGLALPVGL